MHMPIGLCPESVTIGVRRVSRRSRVREFGSLRACQSDFAQTSMAGSIGPFQSTQS